MSTTTIDDRGHPVVDAVVGLMINTVKEDVRKAVPLDHCHCAMALSIQRSAGVGADDVMIEATVSHVLMPCEERAARAHNRERPRAERVEPGELAWMRFVNSKALRQAIEALDTGGDFPATMYTLQPVPESKRLATVRDAVWEHNERRREQGITTRKTRVASRYHRPRKVRFQRVDS